MTPDQILSIKPGQEAIVSFPPNSFPPPYDKRIRGLLFKTVQGWTRVSLGIDPFPSCVNYDVKPYWDNFKLEQLVEPR